MPRKSKTPPETIAQVRKLWVEGAKRKHIVAATGVNTHMVSHFCKNTPRPVRERAPCGGRPPMFEGLTEEDIKVMPWQYILFHQVWMQAKDDAASGHSEADDEHDAAVFLALLNDIYDEWLRTPRPIRNPGWRHRMQFPPPAI